MNSTPALDYTGERVVPDTGGDAAQTSLLNIHQAIYTFLSLHCHGKTVLDIGCGSGHGTHMLHQHAACVWGVDIAPDAVAFAAGRFPALRERVLASDALHVGIADQQFDVVTAVEVLEHIPSDGALLREVGRLLKPGGTALLTTPNRLVHSPGRVAHAPLNPYHVREYCRDELETLLRDHFQRVTLYGILVNHRGFLVRYHHSQGLDPVLPFPLSNIERFVWWHVPPWKNAAAATRDVDIDPTVPPMCWSFLALCAEPL